MLNKLIEYFLQFPGIGYRQAKRFAYFLADKDKQYIKNFTETIIQARKNIKQCSDCFHFFESNIEAQKCTICSSLNRDNLLLIIEKDMDLENIEKSGTYNGRYFVLRGTLLLNGKNNTSELRFKELFEKVKILKPLEIILALSATIEGENTNRYIEKILEPLKVMITKLGRGLSTGTELEYSDSETIKNALESRK